jgi:hypothetical protein
MIVAQQHRQRAPSGGSVTDRAVSSRELSGNERSSNRPALPQSGRAVRPTRGRALTAADWS